METTAASQPAAPTLPMASNDNRIGPVRTDGATDAFVAAAPLHSQTKSNLTPTSEFIRLFLLAIPSRYIPRAIAKFVFPNNDGLQQMSYSLAMGVGSTALSLKYGALVKHDIKNIFSEAVALEKGVTPDAVSYADISASDNTIIQSTLKTFHKRMLMRLGSDAMFFLAAPLTLVNKGIMREGDAKEAITDGLVGVKGAMALSETWNRKTTMFEDLVTFINNKINPRNGLGQPIGVGEIFDLFQHYAEVHQPDKMFRNVLSRDTSASQLNAIHAPVFTRMAELMNLSYAYKHGNTSNDMVNAADFALPKFIYMLGHNLIDPTQPDRTLALVEVMNARGVADVQRAKAQLDQGMPAQEVLNQFGLTLHHAAPANEPKAKETNGVIAKGSTMQLERTETAQPSTQVDASSISQAQALTGRHQQALV